MIDSSTLQLLFTVDLDNYTVQDSTQATDHKFHESVTSRGRGQGQGTKPRNTVVYLETDGNLLHAQGKS